MTVGEACRECDHLLQASLSNLLVPLEHRHEPISNWHPVALLLAANTENQ